ncbi:uncharacterized protein BJ171DRAFT_420818 [Polychytrium aggregatum]|uniref:uncharacterized protein n=1 Tax=Polychytrium aggregatum TaxID=110093 RepID=UPI0022FE8564|nr:uncharacterized protein BJ171DRAFT_420818 [Polychytrium aggregatum]KAI9207726.1 hypothetical protein BJ171DRAFT_420818 [Polychytrium aggregatum]
MTKCASFPAARFGARWLASEAAPSLSSSPIVRTPKEIALRVACTQLLLTRWGIEAVVQSNSEKDAQEPRIHESFAALKRSIQEAGMEPWMTAREKSLMEKDLGKWSLEADLAPLVPRWESFGTLLWSLKIADRIPAYYQPFPREHLFQSTAIIPAFPQTIDQFVQYFESGEGSRPSHQVDPEAFAREVNMAEAWFWRSRVQVVLDLKRQLDTSLIEQDTTLDAATKQERLQAVEQARRKIPSSLRTIMDNIETALEQATARALEDGYISEAIKDDFAVQGRKYTDLSDHDFRDLAEFAEFRLATLAWLHGSQKDWEFERGSVKFISEVGSLWAPKA